MPFRALSGGLLYRELDSNFVLLKYPHCNIRSSKASKISTYLHVHTLSRHRKYSLRQSQAGGQVYDFF